MYFEVPKKFFPALILVSRNSHLICQSVHGFAASLTNKVFTHCYCLQGAMRSLFLALGEQNIAFSLSIFK